MSGISISPYFTFRRIKIVKQVVEPGASKAAIDVVTSRRFQPVCHLCNYGILNHYDYPIHTGKLEGRQRQDKIHQMKSIRLH